jgi:hypothetical protein
VLQKAGSGSGGERTELRFDRCDGKYEAQVNRGRKEGRAEPPKCICAPLENDTVVDRVVVFRVVDTNILPSGGVRSRAAAVRPIIYPCACTRLEMLSSYRRLLVTFRDQAAAA